MKTEQKTKVGTKICTVGRDGSKMAKGRYPIFTGKIYEANFTKEGKIVWILKQKFGGTRSGKNKASKKFILELRKISKYNWIDSCKQYQVCN
jgi:hypothetical protein